MRHSILAFALVALSAAAAQGLSDDGRCLGSSAKAGARCLQHYLASVAPCRLSADAACEDAVRAEGGLVEQVLDTPAAPIAHACSEANAVPLGYLNLADIDARIPEACADWAEDELDVVVADDPAALSPAAARCQRAVALTMRVLSNKAVSDYSRKCYLRAFEGKGCNRAARAATLAAARTKVVEKIVARCGAEFDALGLVGGTATTTLAERVDQLAGTVLERARHFALRVSPPNDLGPTAAFGPHPVGVMTLQLSDAARLNVAGSGPRPLTVEVYYPSSTAAIAGVPKDIVTVLGVPVVETPAYRGVALDAAAPHPLVLFSHGNNGLRIQSFFFAAHLASHGYVVVTPDHHGNTFVDTLARVVDPQSVINRPLDMRALIDQFLAFNAEPGNFFAGAIDADAIGMSGHSFGGYTTFALAGGPSPLGTFTEPRIKAIFPQAPAAPGFDDAYFAGITIPTLIVGGSIDGVTPPGPNQQRPYDGLPAGASVVAYANLAGAGHFTFSDFCEVPRTLLGFLGGFEEACEPRHLPWRHAHDIINYLALNFFDATLRGDAAALARLDAGALAAIEDLTYQSK